MTEKLNRKKIIEEIKNNGFYILDDYLSNQDIDKIKKSLLKVLHYIKPDNEKDLFVHMSNIVMEGYKTLAENQEVDYEVGESDRGPVATNVIPK